MSVKKVLTEINKIQLQNFCSAYEFRTNSKIGKGRGMYWIWTDLTFDELKKIESTHNAEVPISKLVENREELKNICEIKSNSFRIVYNGIGGYKGLELKEGQTYNLRSRINQEFFSNDFRTGTLNIENRKNFNISNWCVSFFNFDENKGLFSEYLKSTEITNYYEEYANMLEMNWRIEFGHPILNRF
jgi:hypothetical protein